MKYSIDLDLKGNSQIIGLKNILKNTLYSEIEANIQCFRAFLKLVYQKFINSSLD